MANLKGINPANSGDANARAVEANVHRLDRNPSIANGRPSTAEAEMPRPEDRKPEALPPGEPHGRQVAANAPAPRKSMRRPLMFALLPVALVVGGYFYVTGGAVMSTDNAYVQADMVGLSTDVAGIVTQVLVHDNQKVAKGDILFKLDPLQFQLALDRAEAQIGNTRNDLVALQASYRNMQAQVEQAQKDVDFNMVNFQRQEQLIANNFTPRATFDAARNTLQGSQQ
jgi:membrane fusion protein, multidrug efflux system